MLRMRKKIEREAERLHQETGIDFKKYQDPEMVEKISDLISFHEKAAVFILGYTALFLIITAAFGFWFHIRGMSIFGIILFLIFAVVLSLLEGPTLGIIKLVKKAVSDGMKVVAMMMDFVKGVRQDVLVISKNKPGAKISNANLVRGVSYMVFIPAVRLVIRKKMKLLAIPVNFVIGNSIFYLTKSLTAAMDKTDSPDPEKEKEQEQEESAIDETRKKIAPLAESVARKVALPARIVFNIVLFLGVPILLIIYLIFK